MTENEFQDCCSKLISREVWANVTNMAGYVIRTAYDHPDDAPFSYDDLEWRYPDNEDDDDDSECEGESEDSVRDEDRDPPEWYEVFAVSDWLADELFKYGEIVIRSETDPCLWFRSTFGQSTAIDWVIRKIEKERQIRCGTDPHEFDDIRL